MTAAPAPSAERRGRLRAAGAGSWRGVIVYLALAFGLSWAAQVALALSTRGGPGLTRSLGGGILVAAALLMWPPAIGAYVARRWVEGGSFADAGLRRGPWRYLVVGWLLPPALALAAMLISLPIYPLDPTFATLRELLAASGQEPPVPVETVAALQIAQGLTVAVLINSVFAFGEEFGWRGVSRRRILMPRLMERLGPWPGLLAHGAIWGFWHAPLIALTGYNYAQHPYLRVLLFTVFGTLMGVLFGWLRLASNSVLPPTIAHASLNAIAGLPFIFLVKGVDAAVAGALWSPVGWLVLLAAIAILHQTGALRRALRPTAEE
jgi:membrane protease YdiL (CAAX protease family)